VGLHEVHHLDVGDRAPPEVGNLIAHHPSLARRDPFRAPYRSLAALGRNQ
jgi:hypothetical protein